MGSAAVLANQVYGPYGTQRYKSGPMPTYTTKGFTGQYADSVTGLDYYNARYYDPVAGVFLSADTVQGNSVGMNPYGYVGGNPETNTDPTGQMYVPHVGSGGGSEDDPNSNNQSQNQNPVNVWWGRVAQKIDEAKSYLNMHLQLPGIVSGIFKRGGYRASITLDSVIAYSMAKQTQTWRGYLGQNGWKNNYAAGYLYITDGDNNLVDQGYISLFPILGHNPAGDHSEAVLMNMLTLVIIPMLIAEGKILPGYTVHTVIFSQLTPCSSCSKVLSQGAKQITNEVTLGGVLHVNTTFSVWTTNFDSVGDPRTGQNIQSPDDIVPFMQYSSGFFS